MFVQNFARSASVAATAAVLAACSSAIQEPSVPGIPFAGVHAAAPTPAVKHRLLYVSNYNDSRVLVRDYPSGNPVKTLTGFSNPQGMCADTADHNVFITNTGAENVLEYAYGASSPSKTYGDPNEYPVACSVDPTSGNLAIGNIFGTTTGLGGVTICSNPSNCKTYTQGVLASVYAIAYAGNGDLYVSGLDSFGFAMAYLRAGGTTWKAVAYSGPAITFPGGMQWDGKYLAVGDQSGPSGYSVIYRCKASGASVSCDDRVVDLKSSTDVAQFFIKPGAKGVVGPASEPVEGSGIATWPYPAGGEPSKFAPFGRRSSPLIIGTVILRRP